MWNKCSPLKITRLWHQEKVWLLVSRFPEPFCKITGSWGWEKALGTCSSTVRRSPRYRTWALSLFDSSPWNIKWCVSKDRSYIFRWWHTAPAGNKWKGRLWWITEWSTESLLGVVPFALSTITLAFFSSVKVSKSCILGKIILDLSGSFLPDFSFFYSFLFIFFSFLFF